MTLDFHGLPVRSLENDQLRVDYLAEAGPRLVRLPGLVTVLLTGCGALMRCGAFAAARNLV